MQVEWKLWQILWLVTGNRKVYTNTAMLKSLAIIFSSPATCISKDIPDAKQQHCDIWSIHKNIMVRIMQYCNKYPHSVSLRARMRAQQRLNPPSALWLNHLRHTPWEHSRFCYKQPLISTDFKRTILTFWRSFDLRCWRHASKEKTSNTLNTLIFEVPPSYVLKRKTSLCSTVWYSTV